MMEGRSTMTETPLPSSIASPHLRTCTLPPPPPSLPLRPDKPSQVKFQTTCSAGDGTDRQTDRHAASVHCRTGTERTASQLSFLPEHEAALCDIKALSPHRPHRILFQTNRVAEIKTSPVAFMLTRTCPCDLRFYETEAPETPETRRQEGQRPTGIAKAADSLPPSDSAAACRRGNPPSGRTRGR